MRRLMSFLFIHVRSLFQAYFCWIKLLTEFRKRNPVRLVLEYKQLILRRTCLLPFGNMINCMLVFGTYKLPDHVLAEVRGRDLVAPLLNSFFPILRERSFSLGLHWYLRPWMKLRRHSNPFSASALRKQIGIQGKLKRTKTVLKRHVVAVVPISFKCGTLFNFTRDLTGNYVNTVLNSLTTAVLIF